MREVCGRIGRTVIIAPPVVIEPYASARDPLPVEFPVKRISIRPAAHRDTRVLFGDDGPVRERDGRAFLEQTGIGRAPADKPVDDLVDVAVAPPGGLLEHRDGELLPPAVLDDHQQVRLPLGELGGLPTGGPVEEPVDPGRLEEVLPGSVEAGDALNDLLLPLPVPEEGMGLDQVQEHLGVPPVVVLLELDAGCEGDRDEEPPLPEVLPHRPADPDLVGFPVAVAGDLLVAEEDPCEHPPVLLRGVVDPTGEHPVEDLVVTGALDLCHPPDAPLGDGADEPLTVPADGAVDERLPEGGRHAFQDLLHLVGERGVVEHDHAAGLQAVMVEERLVAHRPLEPEPLRDLPEHRSERMALALPGFAGDGDVQSVGIDHRPGGKGEDEALSDRGIAFVVKGKRPEHLAQGVAGGEDLKRFFHFRRRCRWGCHRCGGRGQGCRAWRSLPVIPVPELLPPLRTPAAALVVAAGKDGPARELDSKRTVVVRSGERAFLQGIQCPAVPGAFGPETKAVPEKPGSEVERPLPLSL